jgi:hypothetical protein
MSRVAAAVFVITQQDIRHSGATNIPDLLRMVPGLDVAQINANTWAISARGFNHQFSDKLLVLIDGRAVYSPSFAGVNWDTQDVKRAIRLKVLSRKTAGWTRGLPRRGVFRPGQKTAVLVAALMLTVLLNVPLARGQSSTAGEYQVKAAFLYNFAKFVDWPPSSFPNASTPLRICVLGQDPFGQELRDIAHGKTVNGRRLEVSNVTDLQQARSCHILFIASSEKRQIKRLLESLRGADVLTVGDTKGFAEQGGMINFVVEDNRVQFEVSRKAAEQAGLKISSKLLSVAKLVRA